MQIPSHSTKMRLGIFLSYLGDGTLYEVCDEYGVSTLYRGTFILKRGSTGTSLEMVTSDGGVG